jgi:hypothetical protein
MFKTKVLKNIDNFFLKKKKSKRADIFMSHSVWKISNVKPTNVSIDMRYLQQIPFESLSIKQVLIGGNYTSIKMKSSSICFTTASVILCLMRGLTFGCSNGIKEKEKKLKVIIALFLFPSISFSSHRCG